MSKINEAYPDRWMKGIHSDTLVLDAAQMTLQHRLDVVLHFLALAANHSRENVEYVHHLGFGSEGGIILVSRHRRSAIRRIAGKTSQRISTMPMPKNRQYRRNL